MQYGELYHTNYYKEVKEKNRVYYEYYCLDKMCIRDRGYYEYY